MHEGLWRSSERPCIFLFYDNPWKADASPRKVELIDGHRLDISILLDVWFNRYDEQREFDPDEPGKPVERTRTIGLTSDIPVAIWIEEHDGGASHAKEKNIDKETFLCYGFCNQSGLVFREEGAFS